MKSFISSLITASLLGTSLEAVNLENSADSSLFVLGSNSGYKRDYVSQGKAYDYQANDGTFNFSYNDTKGLLTLYFDQTRTETHPSPDHWSLDISFPDGINTGIYRGLERYPFAKGSGFSFSGCGRGCNELFSDVDVLEVGYDDSGIINTFAANILQHCESAKSWPTFIAVRYNSDIPVEATTNEIYGDLHEPESFFYAINRETIVNEEHFSPSKHFDFTRSGLLPKEAIDKIESIDQIDSNVEYTTERLVITANIEASSFDDYSFGAEKKEAAFIYLPADYDNVSMLVIALGGVKNHSIMAFSTTNSSGLYAGLQEKSSDPGANLNYVELECSKIYLVKEYIVREFEVDSNGQITNLAIDYFSEGYDGAKSEGSIRHNSDVPVDFRNPFNP